MAEKTTKAAPKKAAAKAATAGAAAPKSAPKKTAAKTPVAPKTGLKKAAAPSIAAKKSAAPKVTKPSVKSAAPKKMVVTDEQRYRMIAEAAYYRAEANQFKSDPLRDWIEAESDIDALLNGGSR